MSVSKVKSAVIISNLLFFVLTLCIELFAEGTILLPNKLSKIQSKYPTDLSATSSTYTIWIFVYICQFAWMLYTLTLVIRKHAADIIPVQSYVFFSLSRLCCFIWRCCESYDSNIVVQFLFLATATLCQEAALYFIYTRLFWYTEQLLLNPEELAKRRTDVWCVRLMAVNGIMFYAAWLNIVTFLYFAKVRHSRQTKHRYIPSYRGAH